MPDMANNENWGPMVQMFFQAFDSVSEPVFVHCLGKGGSPGRFVQVNDAACHRLGYTKEELLQRTPQNIGIVSPDWSKNGISHGRHETGDGRSESTLQSKDNRVIPVENRFHRFEQRGRRFVLTVSRPVDDEKPDKAGSGEGEEKYRLMVENFRDIFYVLDTDGRFTYVSPSVEKLMGYTPREVVGRSFAEFVHPDHFPFLVQRFAGVLEGKELASDYRIMDKAGGVRWVYSTTSPTIENGAVIGLQGVLHDITARKDAEDALKKSEARFRTIYENAPVMIDAFDEHGRCVLWNRQCQNTLGWTMEEVNAHDDLFMEIYPDPAVREQVIKEVTEADGCFRQWHPKTKNGDILTTMWANFRLPDGMVIALGYDVTDQKKAADALQFNQRVQRQVMDIVPVYICAKDIHGRFLLVNRKLAEFYGSSVSEMTGRLHAEFCQNEEELESMLAADRRVIASGRPVLIPEETMENPDGTLSVLETRKIPFSVDGQPAVLIVADDITDRKKAEEDRSKLEAQYRQSQKLESVGRLAGGVAHDLNNLLSPILGYGDLLLGGFDGHDARRSYAEQIVQAGNRARDIVHQLLAFSRKQALAFKPVDLNKVVVRFESLLRRTIREDIDIRFIPGKALPHVLGDVGQLEQVIMNLAVNAQDAMPEGGALTFETLATELPELDDATVHEHVKPGPQVLLKITDTGNGMDAETCDCVFEPFFSTKGERGTGLGLATVYGIVKQHGGNIRVHSEVGNGTTFKIFLPVSERMEATAKESVEDVANAHGDETILIVEDNGPVRQLTREILQRMGYQVLSAGDGNTALTILDRHPGPVHLVLTDVVMPDMDGKALFERIATRRPDAKVLYMSGYTDDVIAHKGVLDEGVHFIQKPFSAEVLAFKVRETLDQ